jgi:hypothetical protein
MVQRHLRAMRRIDQLLQGHDAGPIGRMDDRIRL